MPGSELSWPELSPSPLLVNKPTWVRQLQQLLQLQHTYRYGNLELRENPGHNISVARRVSFVSFIPLLVLFVRFYCF